MKKINIQEKHSGTHKNNKCFRDSAEVGRSRLACSPALRWSACWVVCSAEDKGQEEGFVLPTGSELPEKEAGSFWGHDAPAFTVPSLFWMAQPICNQFSLLEDPLGHLYHFHPGTAVFRHGCLSAVYQWSIL